MRELGKVAALMHLYAERGTALKKLVASARRENGHSPRMNLRAFTYRRGLFFAAAGLGALIACSSTPSDEHDPDHQSPDASYPDGGTGPGGEMTTPPELDAIVEGIVERCMMVEDDASTEEVLQQARAAYARGDSDIPLSAQGCTRLFVQRSGATETYAAVISPPFGAKFDPETYVVTRTAATLAWTTGANGRRELRGDLDADGFVELRETVEPNTTLFSERYSDDKVLVARTSAKVAPDGLRIDVTEEGVTEEGEEGGALAVKAKYQVARVAHKCTTDPPPSPTPPPTTPPKPASPFPPPPHEVACTPDQLQKLESLLVKATTGGAACMEGAGMKDIRFRLLRQMATTSFDFKCTDDPTFVAANDGGYGNIFAGRALLWINPILFTAVEGEQTATLYHELMHFFAGHDHDVEALADYSTNLAYTDQVYACEQLCFSKKANTCHLAACQKKKICNVNKTTFENATGKTLESCWSGHQVGALCRKGFGERQWCTTKSECDAACGGQECESKSLSCDDDCR